MKKLLAATIGLFLLAGCVSIPTKEVKGDNVDGGQGPADKGTTATFKVTTSAKASVTWGTGSGTSQDEIKKGTWTKKVKLDDNFDLATLTVTGSDFTKSQTVSCEILLNGVSKAKNKSKGKMAMANCAANTTD